MEQIKIIFFDIDGTLIDMQKKQITDRTLETLQRLKEKGIRICLATGRSPVTLPKFEGVEFDAYLTFNGSLCYTEKETIYSNPIPAPDVQRIIQNTATLGRPVSVASKQRLASNGIDEDLAEYYSFANLNLKIAPDFSDVARQEIYQVMLGCQEWDYPAILEGVRHAKITAWWDRAVDIIPVSSGKGIGIQKILNYYRLKRCEALAFGDGNNDIEMLESVGTGVAMKNASPQLIAIADEVCGHVADDGIYHYCIDHQLI